MTGEDFIGGFREGEFPLRLNDAAFVPFDTVPIAIAGIDDGERLFDARLFSRDMPFPAPETIEPCTHRSRTSTV